MEDYLLPGRFFWLIDSHTGTEGARIRTRLVIRDLRRAINTETEEQENAKDGF